MDIHSKKRESSGEKKFSFRSLGITSYHAAPAVLMTVAGLALSAIISDVPPQFNQVFASQEVVIEESVSFFEELSTQVSGLLNPFGDETENAVSEKAEPVTEEDTVKTDAAVNDLSYTKLLATGIMTLNKDKPQETYNFSAHISSITEEEAEKKLQEIEKADRNRELWEASGEVVASSNRNLYLDHYKYQRGPSNIPSTGLYTSCVPGQVISQMQPPASLTFDENGVPENYLYCIEGKATAYYGGYMTATGSAVRPGVVAVDPREIPYGTEMWIVSADGRYTYGFARAEDTGGFIYWPKGATVDLYMNTYADCCVWGWRGVKIYVLPTSYK
jgi:3D (Asp-Asp-Asp) domain-containing protein